MWVAFPRKLFFTPLLCSIEMQVFLFRYDEAKNTMKKHGIIVGDVSFDLKGIMKAKEKAVSVLFFLPHR